MMGFNEIFAESTDTINPYIDYQKNHKYSWPKKTTSTISIKIYTNSTSLIDKFDGVFGVELLDSNNNKIKDQIVNIQGEAIFSHIKAGEFKFVVVKNPYSKTGSYVEIYSKKIILTGLEKTLNLFINDIALTESSSSDTLPIETTSEIKTGDMSMSHCNCVAFTLDAVQDYYRSKIQLVIMQSFQQKEAGLTVGVYGKTIGKNPQTVSQLKEILSKNNSFELANRGWDNLDHTRYSKDTQSSSIKKTNDILSQTFGITPVTFIPPRNLFDDNTLKALSENGITYYSLVENNDVMTSDLRKNSLLYVPQTLQLSNLLDTDLDEVSRNDNVFSKITRMLNKNGFAVVNINSKSFEIKNSNERNQIDLDQLYNLESLLDFLNNKGIRILAINQIGSEIYSQLSADNPIVNAPVDILTVTINKEDNSRNISDLGIATVTDNLTPTNKIIIANNATKSHEGEMLFPIGTTTIAWTAKDTDGNIGVAFQSVTVIANPLDKKTDKNNKRVMINFDDGYSSVYTLGLPIFDKYDIKTTQYIICGNVKETRNGYMSWSDIHEMYAAGHDIQAHSMSHQHANTLSKIQMESEYGQNVIDCFTNNGIRDIRVMALPHSEGWDNINVIQTLAKSYEFARGASTNSVISLHCDRNEQKNCETYTSEEENELNEFNRYNILGWKHDTNLEEAGYDEAEMFSQFIKYVNEDTANTNSETLEIPIVVYHRIGLDISDLGKSQKFVTVTLLDAEMKYLYDNNFTTHTTKDLAYDYDNNWMILRLYN
jgi:peptidoglycan/xylan/chitin deacetylase (PgdA/CDA1 family)